MQNFKNDFKVKEDSNCNKEDTCKHEPDWTTLVVNYDKGIIYVDVNCINCGTNGCVTMVSDPVNISW